MIIIQRISDDLAERLEAGGGGGATSTCTALVVNSFGKIWHVDVGRDGDGAFLGRGWPEFVAAHGIGADWLLVLRHEGRCVLTVKAFNTTGCLNEFGRSLTGSYMPTLPLFSCCSPHMPCGYSAPKLISFSTLVKHNGHN